mmetsp:Transcript_16567/g.40789  ORF Transcript_16567/g.40789 Transcript_16567/m.40789 type:complete len:94 (-) Transcript_16567:9-290(-)
MAARAPPPVTPYHIPQRTLDLKCDSVYFRIRLELRGASSDTTSSGSISHHMFQTVITHALVRPHGVIGGAIPIEHLGGFTFSDSSAGRVRFRV